MRTTFESVLILLAAAVLVVALFRSMKLPPMLGYLIVGIAIGPHAVGWIPETEEARELAEIGVVFLMFTIGLEFSLRKLVAMRSLVFGLGAAQVTLTIAIVWAAAAALVSIGGPASSWAGCLQCPRLRSWQKCSPSGSSSILPTGD